MRYINPRIRSLIQELAAVFEGEQETACERTKSLERAIVKGETDGLSEQNLTDLRGKLRETIEQNTAAVWGMRTCWDLEARLEGRKPFPERSPSQQALHEMSAASNSVMVARLPLSPHQTKSARACGRVAAALREHGSLHRQQLLDLLVKDGIIGNEAKPINRLASILSENKQLFCSHGNGIYSLVSDERTEQRPQPEAAGLSAWQHPMPPIVQPQEEGG